MENIQENIRAKFNSLIELLDYFKEESTGIAYYENLRWGDNPVCPHCGSEHPYKTNRGWKCSNNECYKKFTVRVGTIFGNSKISFRIWFAAIYLVTAHKKRISSVQLAIDLGITQKTAWFALYRIRGRVEYCRDVIIKNHMAKQGDDEFNSILVFLYMLDSNITETKSISDGLMLPSELIDGFKLNWSKSGLWNEKEKLFYLEEECKTPLEDVIEATMVGMVGTGKLIAIQYAKIVEYISKQETVKD